MASALSITSAVPDPALLDLPWHLPLELWPDEYIAALPSGYWLVLISGFIEPLLYLLSIGVGVGRLVGTVPLAGGREVPWLEPMPDTSRRDDPADPASVVASRTGLRLAFIAALQHLPARQRAVLILRDVLQWRAAEVADLLGTTPTAVNGLLIRARARMDQAGLAQDELREPAAPGQRALLDQYVAAFENADAAALSQLLTQDAVFEMPPMLTWFTGRDRIVQFLGARVLGRRPGDFKLLPVAANGQPGFAGYLRGRDGLHHAHAVQVLTVSRAAVAHIVSFNQPGLFDVFALPRTLPGQDMKRPA